MSEERDVAGIWWLPENPTERWIGTLKLAPDQCPQLKFTVEASSKLCSVQFPEVLHGCDQHGHPITLLSLGPSGGSFSRALAEVIYSAGYAILGIELANREEFKVHSLMLHMQYLFDWLGRSGFQRESERKTEGLTMSYAFPALLTYPLDQERSVKIISSLKTRGGSGREAGREQRFLEDACLQFDSAQGFNFAESQELVSAMRHLLHFAILEPVYPLTIRCKKSGYGETHSGTFFPREIEICSGLNREHIKNESDRDRWLFQFSDVQADFGLFLDKWLTILKKFDEAMGCYFTTIYHPLPDVVQLICLTQALVAFHGIKNQSLGGYGLEKQIRELAEGPGASMPGLFDDVSDFAKTVSDTRHYNTHFNPADLAKRVVFGTPLFRVNEKMKLLFQVCVLTEMGIPSERFPRLRKQLTTHIVEY